MPERSESILIVGGGGHAIVVADAAVMAGHSISGFLDDDSEARLGSRVRRLGGFNLLEKPDFLEHHPLILALGDLGLRRRLIERLPTKLATVIHPSAIVSPTATIGRGVYIGPGAIIHTEAAVHHHAIVNSGAIVEHNCVVGANSHIAPNATLGGDVTVGEDTLIGIGSTILPGVHIGDRCIVGAGSAVIHDLESNRTAVGVPARETG